MSEFTVGDYVTFDAYGEEIPARVKVAGAVSPSCCPDSRVWYELTGTNPRKPLITKCTGNSIKESALFRSED